MSARAAVLALVVASSSASAVAAEPDLSLFHVGGTGTLGQGSCSMSSMEALVERPPEGIAVGFGDSGFGVLHDAGRYVFAADNLGDALRPARAIATQDRKVETLDEALPVLVSQQGLYFQWPRDGVPDLLGFVGKPGPGGPRPDDWRGRLTRVEAKLERVTVGEEETLLLRLPPGALPEVKTGPLPDKPEDWSISVAIAARATVDERTAILYGVCRFTGDDSRRIPALRDALAKVAPDRRLLLGVGQHMPEVTASPAEIEAGLATLEHQAFDAIAPAELDLARGVDWLAETARARRLPFVAANLTWKDGPKAGKPVFPRYRLFQRGGRSIAVVGIVPSDVSGRVYHKRLGSAVIGPATEAILPAVRAAAAELGRRPDLVVLLTTLAPPLSQRVVWEEGVDVVVGQDAAILATTEVTESIDLPGRPPENPLPLLVAKVLRLGFGRIDVAFAKSEHGEAVARLDNHLFGVTDDQPADADLARVITSAVLAEARTGSDVVLPPVAQVVKGHADLEKLALHPGTTAPQWSRRIWHSLAAHAARDALKAEVGAVRAFSLQVGVGSSLSRFLVKFGPVGSDHLVAVSLKGSQLLELARATPQDDRDKLVFARFDPEKRLVDGRPLSEKVRYRVALPDVALTNPTYEPILRGLEPEEGPLVQEVLANGLAALRDRAGGLGPDHDALLRERLTPTGTPQGSLWSFAADEVGLVYLFNRAAGTEPFARVRDQRLKLPDFHVVQAKGTLSATYDTAPVTWRSAVAFKLARTFIPAFEGILPIEQRQQLETEDVLTPETELRVKAMRIAVGNAAYDLVPILRAAYETEFTPVETACPEGSSPDARCHLPRRKYLSGTAGVGIFPGGLLKELRVGAIAQKDFSKLAGRTGQGGITAGVKLARPLGPVLLKLDASLTWFPPHGETEPADLDVIGTQAQAVLAAMVPISDWLSLGITADWLGFAGKVPSTERLGQSLQVGAVLQVNRVWKPGY